jgi:Flp pilus assembly CpaE family ATPase
LAATHYESARPVVATLLAGWSSGFDAVVIDCGTRPLGVARTFLAVADESVLVMRSCFLALRHAATDGVRPTSVVHVVEPHRALTTRDVANVLGRPVGIEIPLDPAVSRAVDAGLLTARLPRSLDPIGRLV